jgi:flagellar motor switch protein FliN/FliY
MWKIMTDGFLSQEEIDSLLNGGGNFESEETSPEPTEEPLQDMEKDLLGEIGNISMGSASTALSQIIGQQVNITTPVVTITDLKTIKQNLEVPNIALDVQYTSGIVGRNVLVMKVADAGVISSLMMGGDGQVEGISELSEIEVSAVSEAMNQMIGSAATSMATMFAREVNISPPNSKIWDDNTNVMAEEIDEDEPVVQVSFKLNIGELIDSTIMQILPIKTAKKIVSIMMGNENEDNQNINSSASDNSSSQQQMFQQQSEPQPTYPQQHEMMPREQSYNQAPPSQAQYGQPQYNQPQYAPQQYNQPQYGQPQYNQPIMEKPIEQPPVNVQQASFQPLGGAVPYHDPKNIDLILDVPLQVSVVLGRTKMNVKDILNLGTGSLVELDKLAEEPVEILINGKKVAYGEVVVVDENFGVRITSIISNEDRIRSLGK